MAFVPNSGVVSTDIISDVFGLGDDFNNYRGTIWYYPANLTYGYFSTGTIKSSDFYGKQPNDPATAGVLFSNTAGNGSFVIPLYRNTITIEMWGAGGSGGGGNGGAGAKGGDSTVLGITVGGGDGGKPGNIPVPPPKVINNPSGGRDVSQPPGYYSGQGGFGQNGGGNDVVGSGPGGTIQDCMVPTALITLEDGTQREVQYIQIGDKVRSNNEKSNTVIGISKPVFNGRLVAFNGSDHFITETHPLLTDKGWGTFNLELFKSCKPDEYQKIVEDNNGNDLLEINENIKLAKIVKDSLEFYECKNITYKEVTNVTVYKLSVDGDRTFICENYVSHNKPI